MLIKNITERPVEIKMETRVLRLKPQQEKVVSAEEVRDPVLREHLQVRTIAVVRPATDEEDQTLHEETAEGSNPEKGA